MNDNSITRRAALGSALALAGAGSAPLFAAAQTGLPTLDLEDPATRARVRAKITGSTAKETLHGLSTLHLYAYLNDGNVVPLLTMWNYTVTKWEPQSETSYRMNHYESGIYTKFNTDEVLEYWDNPITGERLEVWPFIGGPIKGELGPDGTVTGENATVKPQSQGINIIGDTVFIPTQSSFSFPNPFTPEVWPKEFSGSTYYWDSFATHSAKLADVLNPDLSHVPAVQQFQNLVSFHPWFHMGGYQGRSFGRAYGTKLPGGFKSLPEFVQTAVKKQTPEMLDVDNWTEFRNDFADYMKARSPKS
jgi:hypothetical protein